MASPGLRDVPSRVAGTRAVPRQVQVWAAGLTARAAAPPWGSVPAIALLTAVMLWLVVLGNALSRSGKPLGGLPFWLGLMVPIGVIAARQASPSLARPERLGLAVLAGLFLYLVKVVREPTGFTFSDELIQAYNTTRVFETGTLFAANPLLPATADYPGLASVTAALASLAHLSPFGAGNVVVGAARLMLIVALYLLLDRAVGSSSARSMRRHRGRVLEVLGIIRRHYPPSSSRPPLLPSYASPPSSGRVAGLGVLFYAAAPNFLYYTAEVSYESLALPLALVAVLAVVAWTLAPTDARFAWAVVAVLLIGAVVVTHHATSYALVAMLAAFSASRWWTLRSASGRVQLYDSPSRYAAFATAAVLAWLLLIATRTSDYLRPVFVNALRDAAAAIAREGNIRPPFESGDRDLVQPLWDRGIAVLATLLVVVGILWGITLVWRRYRTDALAAVFGAAALAYLATLPLRLVPSAWEIANRATEFLFIGVGLPLALVAIQLVGGARSIVSRVMIGAVAAIVFAGGAALGWRYDVRLAQAREVAVRGAVIEPQGLAAVRWSARTLPLSAAETIAANSSTNSLLLLASDAPIRSGGIDGVDLALELPRLQEWQLELLRARSVRYVVMDRRVVSDDALAGYFFATDNSPPTWRRLLPKRTWAKFDRAAVSRLYDSGEVTIYDIRDLLARRRPR